MSGVEVDGQLTVVRQHAIRREVIRTIEQAALAMAGPVIVVAAIGGMWPVLWSVLCALPIVGLVADARGREAGRRLDRMYAVARDALVPSPGAPVPATPSVREAEDLLLRVAEQAQRAGELAGRELEDARARLAASQTGMAELFARRVHAEERGLAIIAAELHDTVAQSLLAAQWMLEQGTDDTAAVHAEIRHAEQQLRSVLALATPPQLADHTLLEALTDLLTEMRTQFELDAAIASWPDQPVEISDVAATTVYRFFQETLRNVVKHSGQRAATIEVDVVGTHIRVRVSDRGRGFDPQSIRPSGGRQVGLLMMDDRARATGGSTEVCSAPGVGTAATLVLPMTEVMTS